MISYKYKFYQSKKLKTFDYMMAEAAFVWNHALALEAPEGMYKTE